MAYDLRKKIATTIMILYRNAKARSPDRYSGFFDIASGDLQGDRLASDLFIISLYYVLGTLIVQLKENDSTLKKETRSRRYPSQIIASFLAYTPAKSESILRSLELKALVFM